MSSWLGPWRDVKWVTHSVKRHWIVSDVTKQGYPLDYWNVTRDGKFDVTLERETTAIGKHSCNSFLVLKCRCLVRTRMTSRGYKIECWPVVQFTCWFIQRVFLNTRFFPKCVSRHYIIFHSKYDSWSPQQKLTSNQRFMLYAIHLPTTIYFVTLEIISVVKLNTTG